MEENNNRIVFIIATMIKELYDLYRWGNLHELYKMTIPSLYFGHKDFLDKGIVKEFYPLNKQEDAQKWIQEDIIDNYQEDYRIHLVRIRGPKMGDVIQNACVRLASNGSRVTFKNHDSTDRLLDSEIEELFNEPLNQHIVLGVKGFYRRANLISNHWKLRIGATHELYTKTVDNSVQIQGLTGRMTGYWRSDIEGGHKTGPHRTSIKAIEEYEKNYLDPFGTNSYQTSGFKKKEGGKVTASSTMLTPKNIKNLDPRDLPVVREKGSTEIIKIEKITELEKNNFTRNTGVELLKKYNEEAYEKYKFYEIHCWKVDTPEKCEKYGLSSMLKEGAWSSPTNIREKTKDTLMIYLYENRIIINPWNGSETK
jgi:hypothetical protein